MKVDWSTGITIITIVGLICTTAYKIFSGGTRNHCDKRFKTIEAQVEKNRTITSEILTRIAEINRDVSYITKNLDKFEILVEKALANIPKRKEDHEGQNIANTV